MAEIVIKETPTTKTIAALTPYYGLAGAMEIARVPSPVGSGYIYYSPTTGAAGIREEPAPRPTEEPPQEDVYIDPETGAAYSMAKEKQPGTIYEVVDGQRVPVHELVVRREGPYAPGYEYEPYQVARKRKYEERAERWDIPEQPRLFGGILEPGKAEAPPRAREADIMRMEAGDITPRFKIEFADFGMAAQRAAEFGKGAAYAPFGLVFGLKDLPKAAADPVGTIGAMGKGFVAHPSYSLGGFAGSYGMFRAIGKRVDVTAKHPITAASGKRAVCLHCIPEDMKEAIPKGDAVGLAIKGRGFGKTLTDTQIEAITAGGPWMGKGGKITPAESLKQMRIKETSIIKTPKGTFRATATMEKKMIAPPGSAVDRSGLKLYQEPLTKMEFRLDFQQLSAVGNKYASLSRIVGPKRAFKLVEEEMPVAYPPGMKITPKTMQISTLAPRQRDLLGGMQAVSTKTAPAVSVRQLATPKMEMGLGRSMRQREIAIPSMRQLSIPRQAAIPVSLPKMRMLPRGRTRTRTRTAFPGPLATTKQFRAPPPPRFDSMDFGFGKPKKAGRRSRAYRYTPSLGGIAGLVKPIKKPPKILTGLKMRPRISGKF